MRSACFALGLLWAALTAAETLYRLPWDDPRPFMISQAPGGRITTHISKSMRDAVDIAMPAGVRVVAARAGVVEALEDREAASAEDEPLTYEGNFVRVRHDDGTAAVYAHLRHQGVAVVVGDSVAAGDLLGYSGASGDVQDPHLHFVVGRSVHNSSGWPEEVSLPVAFYVGVPPVTFTPRAALIVTANYSGAAETPRAPSEARFVAWKPPRLEAGDELNAWLVLAAWLAFAAAGIIWFWRFSRA
jgi:murein DD-endopeptidase MepM/ murein hydrolase activator NlpD